MRWSGIWMLRSVLAFSASRKARWRVVAERKSIGEIIRIAVILTVICMAVAALVSFVYSMTNEIYQENLRKVKEEAIAALFDSDEVSCEPMAIAGTEAQELYRVSENGQLLGYCANVKSAGFGGYIELMVAMGTDGMLIGVEIISLSETPGLGSRVDDAEYLAQYSGMSVNKVPALGEDVDAISGATISSRAVLSGVQKALNALKQYAEVDAK
jgi:electron transport complex protein RnfG